MRDERTSITVQTPPIRAGDYSIRRLAVSSLQSEQRKQAYAGRQKGVNRAKLFEYFLGIRIECAEIVPPTPCRNLIM
jgi:hypothetical protein